MSLLHTAFHDSAIHAKTGAKYKHECKQVRVNGHHAECVNEQDVKCVCVSGSIRRDPVQVCGPYLQTYMKHGEHQVLLIMDIGRQRFRIGKSWIRAHAHVQQEQ